MQMTGSFGALNGGMTGGRKRQPLKTPSPNPIRNAKPGGIPSSIKTPTPGPIGALSGLPGESTGPLGRAPVNAFTGLQPMLKQALASGANAQSPVGDRLNKLPRRRRAI